MKVILPAFPGAVFGVFAASAVFVLSQPTGWAQAAIIVVIVGLAAGPGAFVGCLFLAAWLNGQRPVHRIFRGGLIGTVFGPLNLVGVALVMAPLEMPDSLFQPTCLLAALAGGIVAETVTDAAAHASIQTG